jgi:hypothetical protein
VPRVGDGGSKEDTVIALLGTADKGMLEGEGLLLGAGELLEA